MSRHRPEEGFAEEVLRRVLGINVTDRDDGPRPGMVDALFELPDGRRGALEVTTIGEQEALEREAIAATQDWAVEGCSVGLDSPCRRRGLYARSSDVIFQR